LLGGQPFFMRCERHFVGGPMHSSRIAELRRRQP
jgi:hypothetical protein